MKKRRSGSEQSTGHKLEAFFSFLPWTESAKQKHAFVKGRKKSDTGLIFAGEEVFEVLKRA